MRGTQFVCSIHILSGSQPGSFQGLVPGLWRCKTHNADRTVFSFCQGGIILLYFQLTLRGTEMRLNWYFMIGKIVDDSPVDAAL